MIGIIKKSITVRQLYEYALQHNYIDTDATIVLDIINRERQNYQQSLQSPSFKLSQESLVTPVNNTSTFDLTKVEYSVEDLLTLLSL